MNKKLMSKIALVLCLGVVGALFVTDMNARRHKGGSASHHHSTHGHDAHIRKEFKNLNQCATEKNPGYLAHIFLGAFKEYDKHVSRPLKAGDHRKVSAAKKPLSHVILFLAKESHHFKPIWHHEAHNKKFMGAMEKETEHLIRKEYKEAKDKRAKKEVMRGWNTFRKDLAKGGIRLKLPDPAKEEKKAAKKRKQEEARRRQEEERRRAEEEEEEDAGDDEEEDEDVDEEEEDAGDDEEEDEDAGDDEEEEEEDEDEEDDEEEDDEEEEEDEEEEDEEEEEEDEEEEYEEEE